MRASVLVSTAVTSGRPPADPLVLGVCNGQQAGRVLELVNTKCYLGSGRIDDPRYEKGGTSRVDCLILRGTRQTIVRRWSQAAYLNGCPFDDAELKVGDRLQLGGLKLEVLSPGSTADVDAWRERIHHAQPTEQPECTPQFAAREEDLARRAAAIERTEFELQIRLDEQVQRAADLDARQSRIDLSWTDLAQRTSAAAEQESVNAATLVEIAERAARLDTASAETQAHLTAARADLDRQLEALASDRSGLEFARAELENSRRALEQQSTLLSERDRQQQSLADDLALKCSSLESSAEQGRRDRESLELEQARIATQSQTLAEERKSFESQQTQIAQNSSAAEIVDVDRQTRQAELERQFGELEAGKQALEKARAELEQAEAQLAEERAEVTQRGRQATDDARQLAEQRRELADREGTLNGRWQQLEAERQETIRSQVDLDLAREEINRQRQDHATACSLHESELETTKCEMEAQSGQIAAEREEIERVRAELAAERESIRQPLATIAVNEIPGSAEVVDAESGISLPDAQVAEDLLGESGVVDAESCETTASRPEDVYQRLEALSILRKEVIPEVSVDATTAVDEDSVGEPERSDNSGSIPAPISTAAQKHPKATEEGDDEQSIASYMSQLLERMRGASPTTKPMTAYVPVGRNPVPAPSSEPVQASAPAVETKPPADGPPPPAQPRRPVPVTDLPAMRELANLSAQDALDVHSRAVLMNDIYVKSTVALTAIIIGAVLLVGMSQLGILGLVAGLGCIGVGVFVGARLPALIRKYIRDGMPAEYDDEDDAEEDEVEVKTDSVQAE